MSKKVVLIFPQCKVKVCGGNDDEFVKNERAIAPPLGILYLASELTASGYEVTCVDFNADPYSMESLECAIRDADLAGVSILSFNRDNSYDLINDIKRLRKDLPVIAGGADCILHPQPVPNTELTVVEEAETIIVDIVDTVITGKPFDQLPGVVYKDTSGRICTGKPHTINRDLDKIKHPARYLLRDNKGYSVIGKRSRDITFMITSRGCPKHCTFCAHGALAYQKYRARSAEDVLSEIEQIAKDGYKLLGIVDDNFTADKARARVILQGIIDKGIKLSIVVQGRVDAADYELFCLMKKAGVKGITFGLESGCQHVLDFYKKDTTVAMNEYAIKMADKAGLYTGGIFILGAPMETELDFKRTYDFAKRLPLDITSFWILDYTYGSALWKEAFAKGILRADECNVPAGIERGTSIYPSKFIENYANQCFFRFYRRPSYWIRQIVKLLRIRDKYFLVVLSAGIGWLLNQKITEKVTATRKSFKKVQVKIAAFANSLL